ncbi:MAG: ABC transporter permease subunit [ANME-2 cluster archaeon]|nr:ABC transporter permease subunit [ANME-2 cluster archaeon]
MEHFIMQVVDVWDSQLLTMRTFEHLYMFSIALFSATIIGIGIGIIVFLHPKIADTVLNILNTIETLPDIALLVLLLPFLGLGAKPTIVASILYSILPITRNTYVGLKSVNKEYIYIAQSIGLSSNEILLNVRIPMALPLIAGGFRIALVFTMGLITLGGLIAAGGLGTALQTGIYLYDVDTILVAGLWTGVLAVILDAVAGIIESRLQVRYGIW